MSLARLGPAPSDILESYHDIEMRDGTPSSLKVFKPASGPPGPLLVLCFGGGFVAGDNDQLTENARISVQLFGATVVNVSYRLSPENSFPVQQLDCYDSMKWIADNATGGVLASDPSKGFLLGGVSAGASIAAALSRRFQEDKLAYPLTGTIQEQVLSRQCKHAKIIPGQWLAVPSIMNGDSCPEGHKESWVSHDQNANAPGLSREVATVMKDAVDWDESSELRYAVLSKNPIAEQPR